MSIDAVKSYVQLASGLGETSRAKAKEAAGDLFALSGLDGKGKRKKARKKIARLADELLETAESNRRHLVALVRREVEEAVAKAEARTAAELSQAVETIERLQQQLDELRGMVASGVATAAGKATGAASSVVRGASGGAQPADEALRLMADAGHATSDNGAAAPTAKRATVKRAAAKKSTAKKVPAKKAPAKKAPAKKAPAKKTPAKKTPAKKTPATRATARKTSTASTSAAATSTAQQTPAKRAPAAAKKAPAKKAPAKRTPAKKTPAKTTPAAKKASAENSSTDTSTA